MKRLTILFATLIYICIISCDNPQIPDTDNDYYETTVMSIRTRTIPIGVNVLVKNVVVTSQVGKGGRGFFVQDPIGTDNSGVMIYVQNITGLDIEIGDILTVIGKYQEYFDQSQIVVETVSGIIKTGTNIIPPPIVVNFTELLVNTTIEKYESMLIRIENVEVTDVNELEGTWILNSELLVNNYLYSKPELPEIGNEHLIIIGIIYYSYGSYSILPRGEYDIVD